MLSLYSILLAFLLGIFWSPVKAGPGVYICSAENWTGVCNYQANVAPGDCYTRSLYGGETFGPDAGLICTLYSGPHCGEYGPVDKLGGIRKPGLNPVGVALAKAGWGPTPASSWSCVNG